MVYTLRSGVECDEKRIIQRTASTLTFCNVKVYDFLGLEYNNKKTKVQSNTSQIYFELVIAIYRIVTSND